jgi:hypothetical protein
LIADRETLEELLTIIKNENGRIEAPSGKHDDMMMALAIAHHIRDQVVFPKNPIEVSPRYGFNIEREMARNRDYGERIEIV